MDFLTPEQREKLKAAAEAATPGPWLHRHDPGNPKGVQDGVKLPGQFGAWICDCLDNADNRTREGSAGARNAHFIAAANPAVILALLAELEAEKRKNSERALQYLADEGQARGDYDGTNGLRSIPGDTADLAGDGAGEAVAEAERRAR